jgi:hypothetical protein
MKRFILFSLLIISSNAFATGGVYNGGDSNFKGGDHRCQTPNSCADNGHGTDTGKPDSIKVDIGVDASASAAAAASASSSASANSTNVNQNANSNTAYGGAGGAGGQGGDGGTASAVAFGGEGGSAEQSQGQVQSQSQRIDNSGNSASSSSVYDSGNSSSYSGVNASGNSANSNVQSNAGNNASQSTNINFESTGNARHYNKYGNNVSAYAPAIYSSSACTAGGLSGGVSGFGAGVSLGGAKQDPQCQVRENARILASLDADLALMYLCANPTVDVGTVLGTTCKPREPEVIVVPEQPKPEQPKPEIPVIDTKIKG